MDKHARRQLRKNAEWTASKLPRVEDACEQTKQCQRGEILTALESHAPCPGFLRCVLAAEDTMFGYKRMVYREQEIEVNPTRDSAHYSWRSRWAFDSRFSEHTILHRVRADVARRGGTGRIVPLDAFLHGNIQDDVRVWVYYDDFYPPEPPVYVPKGPHSIDVRRSVDRLKTQMDFEYLQAESPSFFRTTERTARFRDELQATYPRWRAVLNCKAIKEELMMEAWHPRRVEHILTTYGWEAYDNLLGL